MARAAQQFLSTVVKSAPTVPLTADEQAIVDADAASYAVLVATDVDLGRMSEVFLVGHDRGDALGLCLVQMDESGAYVANAATEQPLSCGDGAIFRRLVAGKRIVMGDVRSAQRLKQWLGTKKVDGIASPTLFVDARSLDQAPDFVALGATLGIDVPTDTVDAVVGVKWLLSALGHMQQAKSLANSIAVSGSPVYADEVEQILAPFKQRYIGMDDVWLVYRSIIIDCADWRDKVAAGIPCAQPRFNLWVVGRAGVGKNAVADVFGAILHHFGLAKVAKPMQVSRPELIDQWDNRVAYNVRSIREKACAEGRPLLINEAHTLIQGPDDKSGKTALDVLMDDMENVDVVGFHTIWVGYPEPMLQLKESNQGFAGRITHSIVIRDYNVDALCQIAFAMVGNSADRLSLAAEAVAKLRQAVSELYAERGGDDDWANAREIRELLKRINSARKERLFSLASKTPYELQTITVEDVASGIESGQVEKPIPVAQARAEFDTKVAGQDETLTFYRRLAESGGVDKLRRLTGAKMQVTNLNVAFIGNRGTGMTTAATAAARLLHSEGLIRRSSVRAVTPDDVRGRFAGDSANLVGKIFRECIGGTIVFDNAPQYLADPLGEEVLRAILTNAGGKFLGRVHVVVTGRNDEMTKLLMSDSRWETVIPAPNRVRFESFGAEKLHSIFCAMAAERGFYFAVGAAEAAARYIREIWQRRNEATFANARVMESFFARCCQELSRRVAADGSRGAESLMTLTKADIELAASIGVRSSGRTLDELLAQMRTDFVGIEEAMDAVLDFVAMAQDNEARRAAGEIVPPTRMNIIFTGYPGTGKTTFARLFCEILAAIGLLSSGHLVVAKRGDLIAGVVGQTGIKTKAKLDEALGGGLLLDEAPHLDRGGQDYGKDASVEIMTRMEDPNNGTCFILAGYPDDMKRFLATDAGWTSRIGASVFFRAPSAEELCEVFLRLVGKAGDILSADAKAAALVFINDIYRDRDPRTFGNNRTIREFYTAVSKGRSRRLMGVAGVTIEERHQVTLDDIEGGKGAIRGILALANSDSETRTSADGVVIDVDDSTFSAEVMGASKPTIVTFSSSRCPLGARTATAMEAAVRAYSGALLLARVDISAAPQVVAGAQVLASPTVIAVRDGVIVDQIVGVVSDAAAMAFAERLAGALPSAAVTSVISAPPISMGVECVDQDGDDPQFIDATPIEVLVPVLAPAPVQYGPEDIQPIIDLTLVDVDLTLVDVDQPEIGAVEDIVVEPAAIEVMEPVDQEPVSAPVAFVPRPLVLADSHEDAIINPEPEVVDQSTAPVLNAPAPALAPTLTIEQANAATAALADIAKASIDKPAVVLLYSLACAACRGYLPTAQMVMSGFGGGITTETVDLDDNATVGAHVPDIKIPLTLGFAGGKLVESAVGGLDEATLRGLIDRTTAAAAVAASSTTGAVNPEMGDAEGVDGGNGAECVEGECDFGGGPLLGPEPSSAELDALIAGDLFF